MWQRIHIDFAKRDGKHFLGPVDRHSKWIELANMTSASAKNTVDQLRVRLAAYALPEEDVFDNGPQFFVNFFPIIHRLMVKQNVQSKS